MTTKEVQPNISFGLTRKSLEAVKIYACPLCEAPGVYMNDARTQQFWPGCFDGALPVGHKVPVGDTCPNCGGARNANTNYGELSASMPLWIWKLVLGFKWCAIKVLTAKKRLMA